MRTVFIFHKLFFTFCEVKIFVHTYILQNLIQAGLEFFVVKYITKYMKMTVKLELTFFNHFNHNIKYLYYQSKIQIISKDEINFKH